MLALAASSAQFKSSVADINFTMSSDEPVKL